MAVIEKSGVMKYKDADGNVYLMLPVTTKDNVDGLEEIDAHLVDQNNPHKTSYEQLTEKPFEKYLSNEPNCTVTSILEENFTGTELEGHAYINCFDGGDGSTFGANMVIPFQDGLQLSKEAIMSYLSDIYIGVNEKRYRLGDYVGTIDEDTPEDGLIDTLIVGNICMVIEVSNGTKIPDSDLDAIKNDLKIDTLNEDLEFGILYITGSDMYIPYMIVTNQVLTMDVYSSTVVAKEPYASLFRNVKVKSENITGIIPIEKGGFGGSTAEEARKNIGAGTSNLELDTTMTDPAKAMPADKGGMVYNMARLVQSGSLLWDGYGIGLDSVYTGKNGEYFYRVSDEIVDIAVLKTALQFGGYAGLIDMNGTYIYKGDAFLYTEDMYDSAITDDSTYLAILGNHVIFTVCDDVEYLDITFPKAGIYFYSKLTNGIYISGIKLNRYQFDLPFTYNDFFIQADLSPDGIITTHTSSVEEVVNAYDEGKHVRLLLMYDNNPSQTIECCLSTIQRLSNETAVMIFSGMINNYRQVIVMFSNVIGSTSRMDANIVNIDNLLERDEQSGDKTIQLTPRYDKLNKRYTYANGISSLTVKSSGTFDANNVCTCKIVFISGTTATIFTNTVGAYFTGDDCASGIFTPVSNKTYELNIWWNGISWQGTARGN